MKKGEKVIVRNVKKPISYMVFHNKVAPIGNPQELGNPHPEEQRERSDLQFILC
ncbi:MAG: hypothetical protein ACP5U0_03410 [Caldisphaera sp.]